MNEFEDDAGCAWEGFAIIFVFVILTMFVIWEIRNAVFHESPPPPPPVEESPCCCEKIEGIE